MSKREMFKTATATIACARFGAGEIVSVEYYCTVEGTDWYLVTATERGPIERPVAYPAHHLAHFVL